MERRRLGASDLEISPIGLGCWQLSGGKGVVGRFWPALDGETTRRIVAASLEGGVNWFDTAEAYGWGRSEAALSRALKELGRADGEVVVATKWMPLLRTAGSLERTLPVRLRHLGGFSIDLHQIHAPYGTLATERAKAAALARLVHEKKVRTVGVSNYGAGALRRCHGLLIDRGVPLVSNQVPYSLLDRRIEGNGVLEAARELGITVIAYSPLGQGLLSGKFHSEPSLISSRPGPRRWMGRFRRRGLERSAPVVRELQAIASARGLTPSQVALRWLVQFHDETVVAIPGATKERHARDNAAVLGFALDRDELERLDRVSRPFIARSL